MGIFDNIKNVFTSTTYETKQSPMVMMQNVGYGYSRKDKYEDYSKEGYQENAIVYRCINEISNGASSIPFKIFDGDIELDEHPLKDLLMRPNPMMAGVEYFQALYSHLLLSGNSYATKTEINNQPTELHLLRPDRMRIVASKTNIPRAYEYVLNGKVVQSYDIDEETGRSDVKHFKMWAPMDDYYGCSPMMPASVNIDQHNASAKHNYNLLNNGARPSGAIVFKPKDESGMSIQLSESQRQQLMSDLEMRFTGNHNAGRAMLLEGDFDWKEMGLAPKDMDFIELKNMASREIALCFGVPSQLVGVPDNQTYNNVAEARLALYEETIIPLAKRLESDLNEWLAPSFNENVRIQYDIDSIPAMAERRKRIYENVVQAVREGIISRNEARDRLGYEPVDGGDEVYISANLFPLGSPSISDEEQPSEKQARELYQEEEDTWEIDDESKAESDIDTQPTEAMANEAKRGLDWRKEYNRGGTEVGVARAVQLVNRENLSHRTIKRMHSFFSRHEVDKQAEGFGKGEEGYPSAGRIAWALWGGDSGQSWAKRKTSEINREEEEKREIEPLATVDTLIDDIKVSISAKVKEGLKNKVKEHNDKHGDKKGKRVTQRMLEAVFRRGVGAYNTNPQSVRPSVRASGGSDRWAYARVNAFLYAVRSGKYRGGKFDRDLLPSGHPLKSSKKD
jgi:HK97 family phage portal protein